MPRKRRNRDPIAGSASASPDPITGSPDAHPTGAGVGALGGAVAGGAVGALAGPAGAVAGSLVGAAVGGLSGSAVAEKIDRAVEDEYWRENYRTRPYVEAGADYEVYRPAYRYGWESYSHHGSRTWAEAEPELRRGWEREGRGGLDWDTARGAVRDVWDRLGRAIGRES